MIEISLMIKDHTKFALDLFCVHKEQFRQTFVSTLDELAEVVKTSMIAGQSIAQLTNSEERFILCLDWKSYLSNIFTQYQT